MASVRFIPINKSIFQEGMEFAFHLFIPSGSQNEMHCIKAVGSPINSNEISIIDTNDVVYVVESEFINYEEFCKSVADLPKKPELKTASFAEKAATIYMNASEVLNNLFENPETLGNYEASKEIVNDIVETILVDDFTLKSIMAIAAHDYYTHTHSINVAIYSLSLGSYLGLPEERLRELGEAALLHDLGKSKIDTNIINKKGTLTESEFEEIKKHPLLGYTLGLKLGIKNRNVLQGIRHHHEKMDGSGYPFGMRGESIPLFARIIGACDIFDALTSRRSYKEPMSTFDTLKMMKTQMSNQLDIKLLNKMITMFR